MSEVVHIYHEKLIRIVKQYEHIISMLLHFNTCLVLSVGRIYSPLSLSVLISQIHDMQKEGQVK